MDFIIAQIIGFIGLLFIVISFQKDKRSFTLITQLFASLFFATHFFLLDAWTGSAVTGLSAVRAYVFYLRDSKKWINSRITLYLFIVLFWIAGLLTWKGYISLLPVFSMSISCFALWSRNTKHIRWMVFAARPAWITYDFLVGSYAGLVNEAFIVGSLIIAVIRFDILKKKKGVSWQ